jgi:hypothetical protein
MLAHDPLLPPTVADEELSSLPTLLCAVVAGVASAVVDVSDADVEEPVDAAAGVAAADVDVPASVEAVLEGVLEVSAVADRASATSCDTPAISAPKPAIATAAIAATPPRMRRSSAGRDGGLFRASAVMGPQCRDDAQPGLIASSNPS